MPSAVTLYNDARRAALAATSVHVQGSETDNGEKFSIDATGRLDATNMVETLERNNEGRLTVLTTGGKFWMRGDRSAMAPLVGAQNAARLGSKWVQVPAASGREFTSSNNLKALLKTMFSENLTEASARNTRVTLTELNGRPAYRVADTQDDSSLWMSTDADHHALRLGGPTRGIISFSDWNSAPLQKAPAASEVYHA